MQCRIKLLGALCQTQMGAPLLSHSLVPIPAVPLFKVGFGTYRHNDEKCTATVHSYWLYNTITPIYHKPTITVSLLYAYSNIPNNPWTQGPRQGGEWRGVPGKATPSEAEGPKAGMGFLGEGTANPLPTS